MIETEVDSQMTYAIDRSHAGTKAPTVAFQRPDGTSISLHDFGGKPLIVNLWATWCAPCIEEMPTLDALAKREGDAADILVVSQDLGGADVVVPFFAKQKLDNLTGYLDPDNVLTTAVAAQTLPVTIIYNSDLVEIARVIGGMSWDGDRAAQLIDEADRAADIAR